MSASYRVSKADMEASRLVFVMLKDAKPMRKVAIPILDGMTFAAFEQQVRPQAGGCACAQSCTAL